METRKVLSVKASEIEKANRTIIQIKCGRSQSPAKQSDVSSCLNLRMRAKDTHN